MINENSRRYTHGLRIGFDTFTNPELVGILYRDGSGVRTGETYLGRENQVNVRNGIIDYMRANHWEIPLEERPVRIMGAGNSNFDFWIQGEERMLTLQSDLTNIVRNVVGLENAIVDIETRSIEWGGN